jgi:hypothetical protein
LIACEVSNEYNVERDLIRIFVLNANSGGNELEDVKWKVEAKNTKEGIKDAEVAISRAELRSIVQDLDDLKEGFLRSSGARRKSSSTGVFTEYGTSGIDAFGQGTITHALKIAVKIQERL